MNRAAYLRDVLTRLSPEAAEAVRGDLMRAEVALTNARDALEEFNQAAADAMQWARDDVRAWQRAARDATYNPTEVAT